MRQYAFYILFILSAVSAFAQHEIGGLEKVRLHVSSYMIREPASASVPAFNFEDGASIWSGSEIDSTTETTDVIDQDALNACANAAFQQSGASCFYFDLVEHYYSCGGWDGGWCVDYSYAPVQIPGCTDALQEQIVQQINDGTHPCVASSTLSYPLARNNYFLMIEPGVNYTINITNLEGLNLITSLIPAKGYIVFIQNNLGDFQPLSLVDTDFATTSASIVFQLREMRGEVPSVVGQASDLYVGDLKWEVALGLLGNGDSAGRLVLHEADLTDAIYTRETLKYYQPVTDGTNEIEVIRDGDGFLRQIRVPGSFVDLVDVLTDSGDVIQHEIRFYAPLSSSATKTGGLYSPVSGDLLVTYRLGREAAQGLNDFFIKQFDSSSNLLRTDTVLKVANGTTGPGVALNNWTVTTTANSGSRNISKTLSVENSDFEDNGSPSGLRVQVVTFDQASHSYSEESSEFVTESLFQFIPDIGLGSIGELIVAELRGDDADGSQDGIQHDYRYVIDTSLPHLYGRRLFAKDAFGGWTLSFFTGSDAAKNFGEESVVVKPGESAVDPFAIWNGTANVFAANTFARYDIMQPALDYDGVSLRDGEIITAINTSGSSSLLPVSQSVQYPTFGDYGTEKIEVLCAYMPYDFPKADHQRNATFTATYTPNTPNRRLIGKPLFVFKPDRTKTSYGYHEGSYRGLSDAFVTLEISGYHTTDLVHSDTATDATLANQTHGSTSVSHQGNNFTIDAVMLAAGQSTKTVIVRDANGKTRFIEKWVYTTDSEWKQAEDIVQTFTKFGQLETKTLNGRTVYEANWQGLRKQWEKDGTGLKTSFEYDGVGRVASVLKEGAAGISGVPETRRSNFFYDARDRVVVTETIVSGTDKLIEKNVFDAEGYLISKTDANGLTTTHTYEYETSLYPQFLGMKKTTTYADDTSLVAYVKQNGELWKEAFYDASGGVVGETLYTQTNNVTAPSGSDFETTNRKVRIDTSDNDSATTDDPYVERFYDASGNLRFEQMPSAVSGSLFQKRLDYDSETGQLTEQLETEVAVGATTGSLGIRTITEYGNMGEVTLQGIDVDDDGVLSKESMDRIGHSDNRFITDGGNVWVESTETVYPENGANNPFEVTAKSQVSGLSTSTLSHQISTDLADNVTTTTVTVDRSSNTVTTTINHPDSDTDSVKIARNGLTQSVVSKEGLETTFGFDQAGRKILVKDPRGNSTVKLYEVGKDRVEYSIHGITATVTGTEGVAMLATQGYATQFSYDTPTGRLEWEKNPDGKYTRYGYDVRGQLKNRWGEATYPVQLEYNGFGKLEKQRTFGMANTGAEVDFSGAQWPTDAGSGDLTTFEYFDAVGLIKSRTDALNRETAFTYDARGRVVTEISPDGGAGDPAITKASTYFAKTDELKSVEYSGDADLTPDLDFTYHRSGSIATVEEDGILRTFSYDFDASATSESDLRLLAEDLPSYYTDISDLSTADSGHRHNRMRYNYHDSGVMLGRLGGVTVGVATTSGEPTLATTHYSTSYNYDANGRFNAVDVTPNQTWTYTYYPDTNHIGGRTLSGTDLEMKRDYESDRNLLSRIETLDDTAPIARFDYRYNDLGNREDVVQIGSAFGIFDQGLVVDYGYNDRMEVTRFDSVTGSSASVLENSPFLIGGRSFAFEYDAIGNRSSVTHKGVKLDVDGVTDYQFDWSANALNQINTRENADFIHVQGRSVLDSYVTVGFVPDDLKRAMRYGEFFTGSFELREGTTDAVYADDLDVFSVQPDAWIDPSDGTTVLGDLIDHQQRKVWLAPASENFSYDVRGNLKTDSRWNYTWDGASRLRFIETSPTAIAAGVSPEKFGCRYDFMGRRIAKDVYAWTGSAYEAQPSQSTLYYYDGWNLIYEATYNGITYSGGSAVSATFVEEISYQWGLDWSTSLQGAGGVGGLVAITFRDSGGTAETRYPGFDGNGNLVVLLDENGATTAVYEYGPYGELWRASGADAARNPFRFSTKYHDAETKLYYYGHRYYSPDYGRFISQDPIRESGGLNIYAFVNNNPYNYYDYLGMFGNWGGALGVALDILSSSDFGTTSDFSYNYTNPFFDPFSYQSSFLTTYDIYGNDYAPVRPPQTALSGLLMLNQFPSTSINTDWYWANDYGASHGFDSSSRTEFNSDLSISVIAGGYPIATIPLSGSSDYQYFEELTMRMNGITPLGGEPNNSALFMGGVAAFGGGYHWWQSLSATTRIVTGTSFAGGQIIANPDDTFNYVGVGLIDEGVDVIRAGSKLDIGADARSLQSFSNGIEQGRDNFGRFLPKASGQSAPGSSAVDDFLQLARNDGFEVVGTELSFRTPFGLRRYDAVLRSPGGQLGGVELKSSLSAFNRFDSPARQQFSADRWINDFGAQGVGQAEDIFLDNTIKILWP